MTEWYVRLTEADAARATELLEFAAEPASWRAYTASHARAVLKPDAYVRLANGPWEEHWFLEIDRGTEHIPALRQQLDRYIAFWRSGLYQGNHRGLFPMVLWIVPDEARYDQFIDLLGRLPTEAWPLFKVATPETALTVLTTGQPP